ncbi:MAG: hypothetical protein ACD_28C00284G0008 [uncultured bacterium]|nr:MAG: hypothetical protein ACD_28C00284G0008 [uncultured bacterium]
MLPRMTKWPPNKRIMTVARFATNITIGIMAAKCLRIFIPVALASVLASTNLAYSKCCAWSTRIKAEPKMLSLMTLLSQSITSWALVNSTLTRDSTKKKVPPIKGMMPSVANANRQSMSSNRMLEPTIKKTEEINATMAWDTKSFTASTSDVRLVSSLDEPTSCTYK